ncbi:unnamed protein product [Prunus armeniaca]
MKKLPSMFSLTKANYSLVCCLGFMSAVSFDASIVFHPRPAAGIFQAGRLLITIGLVVQTENTTTRISMWSFNLNESKDVSVSHKSGGYWVFKDWREHQYSCQESAYFIYKLCCSSTVNVFQCSICRLYISQ